MSKNTRQSHKAPKFLPIAEVQRLAALTNRTPSDERHSRQQREEAARAKLHESTPWQTVRAAFGGRDPTHEEVLAHTLTPEPSEQCPTCHGAGYLRLDVPMGHPHFGKPVPCACVERAIRAKQLARLEALADLPSDLDLMTFATFNAEWDPDAAQAVQAARAFLDGCYPDGRQAGIWLVLQGNTGGGKTHLLAAIAHEVLARNHPVMFRNVPRLLDWLKAGFDAEKQDPECFHFAWRFEEVCQIDVLLLDDLGAEYRTEWSERLLANLLNHRTMHRLRTAFSTNLDVDDLDDRVRSRLCDRGLVDHAITPEGDYRVSRERSQQRSHLRLIK